MPRFKSEITRWLSVDELAWHSIEYAIEPTTGRRTVMMLTCRPINEITKIVNHPHPCPYMEAYARHTRDYWNMVHP